MQPPGNEYFPWIGLSITAMSVAPGLAFRPLSTVGEASSSERMSPNGDAYPLDGVQSKYGPPAVSLYLGRYAFNYALIMGVFQRDKG
jgi:hypothetical protein